MQCRTGAHQRYRLTCGLLLQLLMLVVACCCYTVCTAQPLKDLAMESSSRLKSAFLAVSRIDELTEAYENARDNQLFTVEQTDPVTEVEQLANQIGQMVARKTQALKESAAMAEEVAASYNFKPNIQMDDVHYLYCSELKDDDSALEYDRRYLQKVAKNQSAVHVPTDIFRGRSDILNQLEWTHEVEHKMLEIVANDYYFQDTARYMYLVTDLGLLRLFPGMKWRLTEGVTSMYDARRTSWFVEGTTCPKDMLILIDTSGSMQGQNLLLTRNAAKNLIHTLGENDYVAVGQYPGKALSAEHTDHPHLLHDKEPTSPDGNNTCFRTFVQATKRHKERLFSQIDAIVAKGLVDLAEALEFAFTAFAAYQNGSVNNHGARCNSIIALFTDGDISSDMDKVRELVRFYKKQNEYLSKVRIFVYSVGEHRNPDGPLIKLTCNNMGSFTDVPMLGAVTSNVQEGYLTTLRSVGALYEAKLPIEARSGPTMLLHSHFDPAGHRNFAFFNEMQIRDLGFGILTSLTIPIYNASSNNSFLGLVGTDIAIKDWVAMVPKHKLGSNGYAFAVNSNGYVLFHPNLKAKYGWHREPASLDLVEVELDDAEKRRIRNLIVGSLSKRDTGGGGNESTPLVAIETFQKVADGIHTQMVKLGYAYKRIDGTPYVASVALPPDGGSRYAAFGPDTRPAFELTEGGSWTVTLNGTVSAQYPSPWAAYLVPAETPYCAEYYTPPPQQRTKPGGNDSSQADNATADGDAYATQAPSSGGQTQSHRPPGGNRPPTPAPEGDEHHETEQTERLRLTPETLANLLQTLALNSSACDPYWAAALALDMALLDAFFAGFGRRPPGPGGPPVMSAAAAGISGLTAAFPPGAAARYRGWRDGRSAGHYQRAMHLPQVLFASVPVLATQEYNRTVITATPMSTMASPTLGVVTGNFSGPEAAAGPQEPPEVTFFKAVTLRDGFSIAVSGVTLSGRWLADTIFMTTFASLCNPTEVNSTCYLVEDGGYVVSTNRDLDSVGHFLGTVDKPLMRHLVFNLSVFASIQEYDYQGTCSRNLGSLADKFAPRAVQPQPLSILMLPAAASLMLLQRPGLPGRLGAGLMTLPLMPLMALRSTLPDGATFDCIKMGYRYYRTKLSESQAQDSQTSTDELGRSVSLAYLEGTNLVLVAVSGSLSRGHPDLGRGHATGAADYDELRRDTQQDAGPNVCDVDFRYRVRPDTCYRSHPNEKRECGSASEISTNGFIILASVWAASIMRCTFA